MVHGEGLEDVETVEFVEWTTVVVLVEIEGESAERWERRVSAATERVSTQ